MRYSLLVAPRADRQIRKAAAWWTENRPKAPDRFHAEISRAFELITTEPGVGSRSREGKFSDARRIYLGRIRYHLYSRVRGETVDVLAFRNSSRDTPQRLGSI